MKTLGFAVSAVLLAAPAFAEILIADPYARASTPRVGAAFMQIENTGDTADRLVAVRSDAAKRIELHTHVDTGDGVMKMREVEAGFEIPAGGVYDLARGGDHIMFMGLTAPFEQDASVKVILVFEEAGEIDLEIPVDLKR